MKHLLAILYLLFFVLISCNTNAKKSKPLNNTKENKIEYIINGKINGTPLKKVYLLDNVNSKIDSVTIKNGTFEFKGKVSTPNFYSIQIYTNHYPIVLENTTYEILATDNNAIISGGNLHTKFSNFNDQKTIFAKQKSDLLERFSILEIDLRPYLNKVDSIRKIERKLFTNFITENSNTILASQLLENTKLSGHNAQLLQNKLKKQEGTSQLVAHLQKRIDTLEMIRAEEKIQNRKPAPLFSAVNPNGRKTHLKNIIKGKKLFLIDFWASWCPPCRESSPKLKELYAKYHKKGFDILTISEDRSVGEWKSGIFLDGIEHWHNVYDDFNRISSMFGVGALPHMVLLDENGKIIKNRISMSQLEDELEKVFNPKEEDN